MISFKSTVLPQFGILCILLSTSCGGNLEESQQSLIELEDDIEALIISENNSCDGDHKVALCHIPPGNTENPVSICVDENSVQYNKHLKHGDAVGDCPASTDETDSTDDTEYPDDTEDEQNEDSEIEDSENFCDTPVLVRFEFLEYQNWKNGDLQPLVFVGTGDKFYESGEDIELTDAFGEILLDDEWMIDVPGLSIKRNENSIKLALRGHHRHNQGREAVSATLIFSGAKITAVKNNAKAPFEHQGNDVAVFGNANEDEYLLVNDQELDIISTVTVHDDVIKIEYEPVDCAAE